SGSGSVIGRDPLPSRAVSAISLQQQIKDTAPPTIILTTEEKPQDHSTHSNLARKLSPSSGSTSHPLVPSSPCSASSVERSDTLDGKGKRNRGGSGGGTSGPGDISVSAGELLGRTHEELVLLLIQLRRQSAGVCKAMETCHVEIEAQARLAELEMPKRLEHLQKLDELKRHLLDLEKQYEKGKPLVNLVDNMVKLGSLYRGSGVSLHRGHGGPSDIHSVRERLEFNQKVQEQRLLAEERRDWDRVSPDRGQLQASTGAKVQELYRLDRLLQEESGTLQSLQQDKELLEKALGGLRHKLQGRRASPAEAERYRKQQRLLEKELSRIRLLLAHNSKKLEETVAENARLEQDLVVLRQKLQASRRGSEPHRQRSAVALVPDSVSAGTTAALEAELRRVQQLVGDLQRQRQELSIQVRHLTEKSHSLVQQIRPGPTGVAGPIPGRKRHHSTWLETDLDSLVTLDHGLDSPASPQHQTSPPGSKIQPAAPSVDSIPEAPLYVNTDSCPEQIGNYPNARVISNSRGYVKYMEAPGREVDVVVVKKQASRPDCSDSMFARKLHSLGDRSIYKGHLVDGEDVIPPPVPAPPELPPDYPPPPPPPPSEESVMNGGIGQHYCTQMDITEADDRMKRFYGIPITSGMTGGKRVTIVEDGDIGTSQYIVEKQQLGCVVEEEPQDKQFLDKLMAPEDEPVLTQFQRSMSLPRGFGKREQLGYQQQQAVPPLPPVRVPSPRSDSVSVLRNLLINRHRVRFESCSGGSSSSIESTSSQRPVSPGLNSSRPLTAHEQLFGLSHDDPASLHCGITSLGSSDVSPQLSPVFKSEAARAIVMEMSSMRDAAEHNVEHQPCRRAVPKEKRRHHTVSSSQPLLDIESSASPIMGSARSRDDLDMERALRPRLNAPDVVRSTMGHKDFKYNENTIDSILGTPSKIVIPERYIPEQAPELSAEEQLHRLKKAESIRKMLSETTSITASDSKEKEEEEQTSTLKKKVAAEKKQREHLLQLNQILAKQVMEKSKMVAAFVMGCKVFTTPDDVLRGIVISNRTVILSLCIFRPTCYLSRNNSLVPLYK
ncbi:hypothetical protein Cfor_11205, partial [Coptotermes formosanus]